MTSAAMTQPKAGFWIRFVAYFVDLVILAIIGGILNNLLFQGELVRSSGLSSLIGLVYFVYFWSAAGKGQTFGMHIFSLKVVKSDGSSLDYVGAFLRYVGLITSFSSGSFGSRSTRTSRAGTTRSQGRTW